MKTTLAKAATVGTAAIAVAVCGVAVALLLGGPNWLGQAQSIEGYSFIYTGGENPTWTASNNKTAAVVKSSKALPDVIPAALDEKVANINAEATAIAERRTLLERRLEVAKQTSVVDKKALQARLDELRTEIKQITDATSSTAAEVLRINEEIAAVEATIEARRNDVYRHRALVNALDADIHKARQLRQQLADLIVQIDGDLARAAEREEQLLAILGRE